MAPKITSVVGWTGRRSRPSTSGFSCSTTATALLRVRLALRRGVGGDHRVAAELVAERGVHLGRELACPRELKRSNSEAVITGIGTRLSIASSTVQRPSPESST